MADAARDGMRAGVEAAAGAAEGLLVEAESLTDEPLLSFAVPDDLLRAAVARTRSEDVIADKKLMPGVGSG